ncbi:tetratricopeptide repeat protein [candidate division KSB1 bacterium]|nr:tetratricopeptide repeat protein [candidate division KSB1 bacterium]
MKKTILLFLMLFFTTNLISQQSDLTKFFDYYMNNDFHYAKNYLESQIKENSDDKNLHFYLGKTLLALKKYQPAKMSFGMALKNGYPPGKILKYLGQINEEQGLLAEAIEKYQLVIRLEPESNVLKMKLASLFYKQQNYSTTISILKNFLKQDSTNLQAYYLLGRSYLRQERYDSTLAFAPIAIALDSTHVPNLLNFGIACFEKNKLDSAANVLEKASELSPKSDEAKYYLAKTYAKTKRLPGAIELLETCKRLNGRYRLKAKKLLVQYYHVATNLKDCFRAAKDYLKEKPDEGFIHHFYGRALSDSSLYNFADEEFNKAILFSNEDFLKMTYFYRGLNFYSQKNYSQAIKWYKKVISVDTNFSSAYYNLAVAYDMYYEDKSTAIRYYKKFLELAENEKDQELLIAYARGRLSELKVKEFFRGSR